MEAKKFFVHYRKESFLLNGSLLSGHYHLAGGIQLVQKVQVSSTQMQVPLGFKESYHC